MWLFNRDEAQGLPTKSGATERAGLADFDDAGHFYNWGFLLPLCKASGLLMVGVDASKPLPVFIEHSDLPMTVFAPPVFSEFCGFPNFHLGKYITLIKLFTRNHDGMSLPRPDPTLCRVVMPKAGGSSGWRHTRGAVSDVAGSPLDGSWLRAWIVS
jgi:hypothetical protein